MDIKIKLCNDVSRTQEFIEFINKVYGETRKDFIGFKPDGSQYVYNDYFTNKNQIRDSIMNNEFYIAEVYGKLAGCIRIVEYRAPDSSIHSKIDYQTLAVGSDFRGKGIGRKLVDFAERFAIKKGYLEIECDTFMFEKNVEGKETYKKHVEFCQNWYEKMGYEVVKTYALVDHPRYSVFSDKFQPGIIAVYFKKLLNK